MFEKIRNFFRRWGNKMINKSTLKDVGVPLNTEQEQRIDLWKCLYDGTHDSVHKIHYNTIAKEGYRYLKTMKMPKVACEEMARLIFNEKAIINIGNEKVKTKVDQVLKANRFDKRFQEYLEKGLALGGLIVKAYYKDRTKLSFVLPDAFIPTMWENGQVKAGIFITESTKGEYHYTKLEHHEWKNGNLVITNELYESKLKHELGHMVNLEKMYPDLEPVVSINTNRPLFEYFKPNIANNLDIRSPEGISIFANSIDTIRAIDTAFDSFHREFKLGKKRIIVPVSAIRLTTDENGETSRYFDANDEVYEGMKIDEDKIQDISVELRVDEHVQAIQNLLDLFAMQVGFSTGTFTFTGGAVKTATEIISMQSKTFRTLASHEINVEEFLIGMVRVILDVEMLYTDSTYPTDYDINVEFDDSIIKDKDAELEYVLKLLNASLMSPITAMMEIRGLTEPEARKELEGIKEARSNSLPDVMELYDEG